MIAFTKILVLLTHFVRAESITGAHTYVEDKAYDLGEYGSYPVTSFYSSNVIAPTPNILKSDPRCDDGSYIMLSVRGGTVGYAGPLILDHAGNTIWTTDSFEATVYGLDVQKYKGKDYLTLWSGDDAVRGHGAGEYFMLDETYDIAHRFTALNGLEGDLHEFKITDEDTILITIYQIVPADLTSLGGPEDGEIWDCLIQELNFETNELLFEWRATDHYTIADTLRDLGDDGAIGVPWDWYHINSVEKDPWGNYLTSARYTHSVTYINGSDGNIIWILGGKDNSFTDLSIGEGNATTFRYQHHARWHDNYTTISLFDNNAMDAGTVGPGGYSRGMRIQIDQEAMTAKLLGLYINTAKTVGISQGSTQVLPNGNVLNGYGYVPAYSEFTSDGELLCEVHFGPETEFNSGNVQSYRNLKANWIGRPTTKPSLALFEESAYISWNGATEVEMWELQNADVENATEEEFELVEQYPKMGFETEMKLEVSIKPYIRVVALDKNYAVLGVSEPLKIRELVLKQLLTEHLEGLPTLKLIAGFCTLGTLVVLMQEIMKVRALRRPRSRSRTLDAESRAGP